MKHQAQTSLLLSFNLGPALPNLTHLIILLFFPLITMLLVTALSFLCSPLITNRLTQNKSVTNMNKITDQTKHKMIVPFMYYIRFGLKHSRELTQNKIHKFITVQAQNTIFFPQIHKIISKQHPKFLSSRQLCHNQEICEALELMSLSTFQSGQKLSSEHNIRIKKL